MSGTKRSADTGRRDAGKNYEDIIHLPHHVSTVHPRMAISDRAAQFSPFAALTGYGDAIQETARLTDEFSDPDEHVKGALDEALGFVQEHIREQPVVTITYFQPDGQKDGGSYLAVTGAVKKVDTFGRKIILADKTAVPMEYVIGMDVASQPEPEGG